MKAGIVGASGYTGVELLRLLAGHPDIDVAVVTAHSHAGEVVGEHTPSLAAAYPGLVYEAAGPEGLGGPSALDGLDGLDVVFCALPHGESQRIVPALRDRVGVIVDLAADFRLRDAALYPTWYGEEHAAPEMLAEAAFGLPELFRPGLAGATLDRRRRLLPDHGGIGPGAAGAGRPGRGERDHRRRGLRGVRRRPRPQGVAALRRGRRGLHGVRLAAPSPHARDGADPGGTGAVHAASRPHGPGDLGDVLRPPGGWSRHRADRTDHRRSSWTCCTRPTTTSPSSWSRTLPPRPRPPPDRIVPT